MISKLYKMIKKYEIHVPGGAAAIDLYENKPLKTNKDKLTIRLTKYGSAWIKISKQ